MEDKYFQFNPRNATYRAIAKAYDEGKNRDEIEAITGASKSVVSHVITQYRSFSGCKGVGKVYYTQEEIDLVKDCVKKGMNAKDAYESGLFKRSYISLRHRFFIEQNVPREPNKCSTRSEFFEQSFIESEKAYIERISERPKKFPMPTISILKEKDPEDIKIENLKHVDKIKSQHQRLHNPEFRQSALFHKIMQGENVNLDNL